MNCKVITLENAKKRQENIKNNLNNYKIKFEFVNGVTRDECVFLKEDNKNYVFCRDYKLLINEDLYSKKISRKWINFGEIAAYLAHYFIWKEFLNSNDKYILICEDDALLKNKINIENYFNEDVHFLNLQEVTAHYQNKKDWFNILNVEKYIKNDISLVKYKNKNLIPLLCEGLAAYAIDKVAAKILCDYIDEFGYIGPNDWLMSELAINNSIEIYSPLDIENYFTLDPETYSYSYTHSGNFKIDTKINELEIRSKY
jgi:GR25 family glycosyltransferase involved in LPS biosynthesis